MENHSYKEIGSFVNIGCGKDITIFELAQIVKEIVNYSGEIVLNPEKPDGTPQKLLDISKLNTLGWAATTSLRDGIEQTYRYFQKKSKL